MSKTPHRMVLDDILAQFKGKTADEVAAMVKKRGIKGRMGTTGRCPMALLLDGVSTGRYVIGRKFIARQSGKVIEKARTPDNLATFVRKFDIGGYPDLIAPSHPRVVQNHTAKLVGRFHE